MTQAIPTLLLDTREVAVVLGVNVQHVRKLCRTGRIDATNISLGSGRGSRYRVTAKNLGKFMQYGPKNEMLFS